MPFAESGQSALQEPLAPAKRVSSWSLYSVREGVGARLGRTTLSVTLAVIPAVLTVYLGLNDGGMSPSATGLVAAELAMLLVLLLGVSTRIIGWSRPLAISVALLGAFALWTLFSDSWSHSTSRALIEVTRITMYGLALAAFGLLPFSDRRLRWTVYALAGGITLVCAIAFASRAAPDLIGYTDQSYDSRLGYPMSYWNALGIFCAVGLVLCLHLASARRTAKIAKVLGAAAMPLIAATLLLTLSRGGVWVAGGAMIVYAVLARPRGLLLAAVAVVPTTLFALRSTNRPEFVDQPQAVSSVIAQDVARDVLLAICLAAALRALLLPLDRWLRSVTLPPKHRKPVLIATAVATAVLVIGASVALDAPGRVSDKYQQFISESHQLSQPSGTGRLADLGNNGRREHWQVALDAFSAHPWNGTGAGTYELLWARDRSDQASVRNAHSLYFEVLGELGLPGLILLAGALLTLMGGLAVRMRGRNREVYAAIFAAGLAWLIHAGVDWDWEMPATTLWFFALAGVALAPRKVRKSRPADVPTRIIAGVICLVVAGLGAQVSLSETRLEGSLDALDKGDCATASARANDALGAQSHRPAPYQIIGFCLLAEQKPRAAVEAMHSSIDRDPSNWELRYNLSIAKAAAGRDPRADAARALRMNPMEPLVALAAQRFRGGNAKTWRRDGQFLTLVKPGPPTP